MSRNRSHEPSKPQEELIPISSYNALVQNFQNKLSALEKKYQTFVHHCTKIIREAQSLLDQSINEHMANSMNASSKLIESLTQQKVKLQDELVSIEKISTNFNEKSKDNQKITKNLNRVILRANDYIISKLEDPKVKICIQKALWDMQEKIIKRVNLVVSVEDYKNRAAELENLVQKKDKDYAKLQEYVINLKNDYEMSRTIGFFDFKNDRKVMSPTARSPCGRMSPSCFVSPNKASQQKDQEIEKLKADIQVLQEKMGELTEKAQKIVMKKEVEMQKNIEDFKVENVRKNDEIKGFKEIMGKANDKIQGLEGKIRDLIKELGEKDEKIVEGKGKEDRLVKEIEKLKCCKEEFESEVVEMKEYFQSDIDNLSRKVEKLFGENLKLKQGHEEIREKCEKIEMEKEKLRVQMMETREKNVLSELEHGKGEIIKGQDCSVLALKQKIKDVDCHVENLQREIGQYKVLIKINIGNFIFQLNNKLSELSNLVILVLQEYGKKLAILNLQIKKFSNTKTSKSNPQKPLSLDFPNSEIQEIKKSEAKLHLLNEKLVQKCNYYEDLLDKLNKNCEMLSRPQDFQTKNSTNNQNLNKKDEIISSLQQTISNLEKQNLILDKQIQNIEFAFQSSVFDSNFPSKDYEKSYKSKHYQVSSSDLIKTFDSNLLEISASKVDLTYTLENTSIKSSHNAPTLLQMSEDEIKDLESI